MKPANASRLHAPRRVLAVSIASLAFAGSAFAADVIWNGAPQSLTPPDGGNDVTIEAGTVVTLGGPGTTVSENSIFNRSLELASVTILTINSADATNRTLLSGVTQLAGTDGQSLVISGSANFRPGLLADGGFTNVQLVKDGGTGELILDGIFNDLDGALLRVVSGTVSVEGGGGTANPISTLSQAIRIDGTAAKLRLGTLDGSSTTFDNALLVNESGTLEHTALSNDTLTGSVIIGNSKTLTASITAGSLALSGGVNGGGLTKTGGGTLILSGVSGYTGATNVSGGTLQFTKPGSLYGGTTASWTPANITVSSGATLAVNVGGAADFTTTDVSTLLTQLSTVSGNGLKAGSSFAFDTTNSAGVVSYSSAITNSTGTGGGAVGIAKLGLGTLSLTGVNTYSGGTIVSNGTLLLNGANTGTGVIRGVVTINQGATLQLASPNALGYNAGVKVDTVNINGGLLDDIASLDQGFNQIYNLTGGTMRSNGGISSAVAVQYYAMGTGTAVNTFASATTSTIAGRLNLRNDNFNSNVTFTVEDGAAPTDLLLSAAITESFPAVGITKAGPGFMRVTGANSYTGATMVSGGTLSLSGSLGNTAITVSAGATFAARHGGGIGYAGTGITAGSSGLTLNGGAASAANFTMVDDAIGTFRIGTGGLTTLTGPALPTLSFEIGASLGSIDRLDLGTMGGNASIALGTKVRFSALSSATSLVLGNYTFLTTAANGLGPSVLTLESSTITIGANTYNLTLANSTATQEILTVSATTVSNNSVIGVTPSSLSFGRVLATAIGSQTLTVNRISGASNTGATAAVTGGAAGATIGTTASGNGFITGLQSWVINVGLTGSVGAHSDTVVITNTGNDGLGAPSGGPGQGNGQIPINVSVAGNVLGLRTVTSTPLSLGRQLATTNLGSLTRMVDFQSTGSHADTTDVTVDGTLLFNGTGNILSKSITGQSAAIAASGTFYSAPVVTGESGLGDTYANVPVGYTATPLALRGVTGTAGDLGRVMAATNINTLSKTVTFTSTGTHDAVTDVIVDGTVSFNGGSNMATKNITGQSAIIGSSGTYYSAPVVSGEGGLGDTYANVLVGYTATPLQNRVITADTVSFGLVHVGAAVVGATTLRTTGAHTNRTAISVGNASSGGFSLTGGTNPVFNDASVTDGRTLGGTLGTAGTFTNAIALTLTPGTEAGVAGTQSPVPVAVTYDASVFSGSAVWNVSGPGSWGQSASGNWTDSVTPAIHAAPGTFGAGFSGTDTAIFNAGGSGTVTLDTASPSLAAISFTGGSHTIARGTGPGVLTMKNDAGPATITDSSGSQSITAPVVLSSDLIATVTQAADTLTLSGGITGAGKMLTKEGAGVLTLSGVQGYAILDVNAGTTNVNGSFTGGTATVHADATTNFNASQSLAALTIGSGVTVTFGDGASLAGEPEKFAGVVPEPGSAGLFLVGVLGVLGRRARRQTRP